jgi:NADH dehydrogenase
MPPLPHVVILGGGFGGLTAAKALRRAPVRVTLIDRRNHHLFQPLLYQAATSALAIPDIAAPIRHILRAQLNTTVLMAEATAVDVAGRRVLLADGEVPYDRLIIATGVTHNYFGHDEWAVHAPGMKTVEDALEVRRRTLLAFEAAEREADPERRRPWLTFVIIGGGPTGVELAGALAEIATRTLARDFRNFDPRTARVVLFEGGPRILPTFPESLSDEARRRLERLGVEVRTGCTVTCVDGTGVDADGQRLEARTVLWAAGVAASSLGRTLGVPLDRAGRVQVQPTLALPGHPEVFVVGDLAAVQSDGEAVPGVAPAAIQGGRHVARNILRDLRGEPLLPFRYRDKGALAEIGTHAAVASFAGGRLRFSGMFAWVLWLLVHLLFLIGFRNRLVVLFQWAWAYLTFQRTARVILAYDPGRRDVPTSRPS